VPVADGDPGSEVQVDFGKLGLVGRCGNWSSPPVLSAVVSVAGL
jgi:hypothetical protein